MVDGFSGLPPIRSGGERYRRGWHALLAGVGLVVLAGAWPANAAKLNLRCTNPASGAAWPVVVDLDHSRVDSFPATLTKSRISWRDPARGYFDFDRATGALRMRNASSTGGYFLHFTCRPR